MSLLILADEGTSGYLVRDLRAQGYEIEWVAEINPGIPDEDVITLAKEKDQVLITEDKDFGEWVFAHQVRGLTIIFLRYEKEDYPEVLKFLLSLLDEFDQFEREDGYEFITINRNKVRRRKI